MTVAMIAILSPLYPLPGGPKSGQVKTDQSDQSLRLQPLLVSNLSLVESNTLPKWKLKVTTGYSFARVDSWLDLLA